MDEHMITSEEAMQVMAEADLLHSAQEVATMLDRMAVEITAKLGDKSPLVLCVMTGGVIVTGHLLTRLNFPLEQDYLHATRYRGATSGSKTITWLHKPEAALVGRHVLLVDDILDEGYTLREVARWCREQGAASVHIAVLADKQHDRRVEGIWCDFSAIELVDRYVFGFGMDYKEYWRNANGIYAVKGL
ncbi:MAG: hypoxanthine-guanine phosphoribosyltransferase [Thiothrix lacustris]|uniref:Hypoxanthine-guanine phosphoribosyltransferase n=1 Tax=Thiothrix lacustris TaxID=525917 RepID=A0A1Y1Q7K9_9GAMM|nr:MAG: hypoxanthine-guanine phosphoribosyltransferase [Thiothrix lacustris]